MKIKRILILLLLNYFTFHSGTTFAQKQVQYKPSDEDILNPERGFYYPFLTYASKYTPLKIDEIKKLRNAYTPFKNAPFTVASSLILRIFILDGFQGKTLTPELLKQINADFDAARQAGVKCIIRFAYNFTPNAKYAPPFKDAPLGIVQKHLSQLTPIFKQNKDVIAIAQLGFIGVWGEGYYTDYYGIPGHTTNQNLKDRVGVLEAYLKALPSPLIVQIRYPTMKQDYFFFTKKNSSMSRIGFHNDAFLSSSDDMGTFKSYDISDKAKKANTKEALFSYMETQTANTAMGGESAMSNPPYDKCSAQGGQAEKQLSSLHFSYINSNYNPKVLSGWAPCINDIKKKLGYRFVLKNASFPSGSVMAGDTFSIVINLQNEGYATPINRKNVSLILQRENDNKIYSAPVTVNVKGWKPGKQILKMKIFVPTAIVAGTYKLFLKLADENGSLKNRSEYAIQFANGNIWNKGLAANDLQYKLQISGVKKVPVNIKGVSNIAIIK